MIKSTTTTQYIFGKIPRKHSKHGFMNETSLPTIGAARRAYDYVKAHIGLIALSDAANRLVDISAQQGIPTDQATLKALNETIQSKAAEVDNALASVGPDLSSAWSLLSGAGFAINREQFEKLNDPDVTLDEVRDLLDYGHMVLYPGTRISALPDQTILVEMDEKDHTNRWQVKPEDHEYAFVFDILYLGEEMAIQMHSANPKKPAEAQLEESGPSF